MRRKDIIKWLTTCWCQGKNPEIPQPHMKFLGKTLTHLIVANCIIVWLFAGFPFFSEHIKFPKTFILPYCEISGLLSDDEYLEIYDDYKHAIDIKNSVEEFKQYDDTLAFETAIHNAAIKHEKTILRLNNKILIQKKLQKECILSYLTSLLERRPSNTAKLCAASFTTFCFLRVLIPAFNFWTDINERQYIIIICSITLIFPWFLYFTNYGDLYDALRDTETYFRVSGLL